MRMLTRQEVANAKGDLTELKNSLTLGPKGSDQLWWCDDSPINVCIYDGADDPAFDCCVFCGNPQERK